MKTLQIALYLSILSIAPLVFGGDTDTHSHSHPHASTKVIPEWKKHLKAFEMLIETDTWHQKADMPTPRSTNTCVVDEKIYAIGGSAPNNIKKKKPWRL